jgi:hypothetical protein
MLNPRRAPMPSIRAATTIFPYLTLVLASILAMAISPDAFALHLPGNQQFHLTLCDPAAATDPNPHYFHINIFKTGTFVIRINNAVPPNPLFYDTPVRPAGTQCETVTIITQNVPNNSTANMINVASCYIINSVPTCNLLSLDGGFAHFVVPVLPTLTLSPATSPITVVGTRVITARVTSGVSGERFALIEVLATCQPSNGALVNVSPVSAQTNLSGEAQFTINAQKLVVPLAGGTPSAVCTFTARDQSGVNTSVKTINYQGVNVDPNITLSSSGNLTARVSAITATLNSTPPADLSSLFIDTTCITQLATVMPSPASALTNAGGSAVITLHASGLVNIHQTLSVIPSANCTFKVRNSPAAHQATLNYLTANACTFSTLLPKPAECGNP